MNLDDKDLVNIDLMIDSLNVDLKSTYEKIKNPKSFDEINMEDYYAIICCGIQHKIKVLESTKEKIKKKLKSLLPLFL